MNFSSFQSAHPQNSWEAFKNHESQRTYRKGEMIYLQGETADRFFYLKSGSVKIFLTSDEGMEKTLTLLEEGNIFGEAAFFDGLPRVSSAKALAKSQIVSINKSTLMGLFQKDPPLAFQMLQYLSKTVRMLSAHVDHMTFLQADKRIAQLLLNLTKAENDSVIHCTHEDLGNLAGTSRITVSRVLNDFARRNWVRTQYRTIKIIDYAALEKFSQ